MKTLIEKNGYILSHEILVTNNSVSSEFINQVKKNKDKIEQAWIKEQELKKNKLVNLPILNLSRIERSSVDDKIYLHCFPVDYKYYLAQRSGVELGITPLAVSGITFYTKENENIFFVGERSEMVTSYQNFFEFVPSGSIEVNNNTQEDEKIDYLKQVSVELEEELSILKKDVLNLNAFCVIFDEREHVYDIGVEIKIKDVLFKGNDLEYKEIVKLPLNSIEDHFKNHPYVDTSLKLFRAWIASKGLK
jgi:predicted NUDIX family phosphoesterase